tara:strand:- start:705 stop:1307 length:603 start_codon:yes stop_codon:yes gene_type:complete
MSLWGGSSADESKPKFLVRGSAVAEPDNCIATEQGWVYRHYQNDAKTEYWDEVLIAGSFGGDGGDAQGDGAGLEGVIGNATIVSVHFVGTEYAQGDTLQVAVNYNEEVDVAGTPRLNIASTGSTNPVVASYASGTGSARLVFAVTMPSETANISLAAQTIDLNSGTIRDKGTTTAADLAFATGDIVGPGGTGAAAAIAVA